MDPILDDLTPEQRAAVTHAGGPAIIVAGPGSGKTRVIARRVAWLVDRRGVPPRSILAITFTNKAADEMRARVDRLIGSAAGVHVSTFHSFCARRVLRRFGPIGRTADFTIYDEDDQRACVRRAIEELKLDDKMWKPGAVLARISQAKNRRTSAEAFDAASFSYHDRTVAAIYRRYEELLSEYNALDFDDLLLYTLDLLEKREDARAELRERFRYILVDEFQDTNLPQYEIANLLAGKDGNLFAVGDPDQSVYKWRGAEIRNILEFERDHPSAVEVRLERNYRSTRAILAAAQRLIEHNVERREKTLVTGNDEGSAPRVLRCMTDDEEAQAVARDIARRIEDEEARPAEIAVFYRKNSLSRKIEERLRALGIRHVVVGDVAFYQRKEVKDVLAFVRLLANPQDEQSIRRAIAFADGFGAKTLERIAAHAQAGGRTLLDAIRAAAAGEVPEIQERQRKAVARFAALVEGLGALPPAPVEPILRAVVERTGALERLRKSQDPQDRVRAENVEALIVGAREFDEGGVPAPAGAEAAGEQGAGADFRAFLDRVALLSATDQDADGESVKLMTLHAAKGLEFDEVTIVGVDRGILPLERDGEPGDEEEERRLFYVGLTRARRRVTLTTAALRRTYGRDQVYAPSPFLREALGEAGVPGPVAASGGFGRAARRGGDENENENENEHEFADEDTRFQDEGDDALAEGDRVVHPLYGVGRIVELHGRSFSRRVRVQFDAAGEKNLVLQYSRLKRVGR